MIIPRMKEYLKISNLFQLLQKYIIECDKLELSFLFKEIPSIGF